MMNKPKKRKYLYQGRIIHSFVYRHSWNISFRRFSQLIIAKGEVYPLTEHHGSILKGCAKKKAIRASGWLFSWQGQKVLSNHVRATRAVANSCFCLQNDGILPSNKFAPRKATGVRGLVQSPSLLSSIQKHIKRNPPSSSADFFIIKQF